MKMEETENRDTDREEQEAKLTKHKGKHDKPKPWDDESIDHWKVEKFDPSWNGSGMLEVSSFSTLFPQYRGLNRFLLLNMFAIIIILAHPVY